MDRDIDAGSEEPDFRRSKSERKRAAASLQELGVELSALPAAELATLGLPEKLLDALAELKRLTSHGALVRQRQYVGKLMRTVDAEPLYARLDERKRLHDAEVRRFQHIELWRDRLLAEPSQGLAELLEQHPRADRAALAGLVDRARTETAGARPPAAARELFAHLRKLLG